MNPKEMFLAGCRILDPIMKSHGFTFVEGLSGRGSGGNFTRGDYVRDDRRLELHFRYSLGLVAYHIGSLAVSHGHYMRALLGHGARNKYPGFSDDPLDGFRDLANDLENCASDFLNGSGEVLINAASKEVEGQRVQQKVDMAGYEGDTRKREEARSLFRESDFRGVVERLHGLRYPELMQESERRILEMSKRKLK